MTAYYFTFQYQPGIEADAMLVEVTMSCARRCKVLLKDFTQVDGNGCAAFEFVSFANSSSGALEEQLTEIGDLYYELQNDPSHARKCIILKRMEELTEI